MKKTQLNKKIILLIAICVVALIIVVSILVKMLSDSTESINEVYPTSELSSSNNSEMPYWASDSIDTKLNFPNFSCDIGFMESAETVDNALVAEFDDTYHAILKETDEEVGEIFESILLSTVDVNHATTATWEEIMLNKATINSLESTYHEGIIVVENKVATEKYYALAYELPISEGNSLVFGVYIDGTDYLEHSKKVLNNLLAWLNPKPIINAENSEVQVDETKEDDNSSSESETVANNNADDDDFYIEGNMVYIDGVGYELIDMGLASLEADKGKPAVEIELHEYEYEYEFEAGEKDVYLVFEYHPQAEQLTECYALSPTGRRHHYDSELSFGGHYVVPISSTEAGTYILKISCLGNINDLWSADYTIDSYYATFFNSTPDGEPLMHGFDLSDTYFDEFEE